MAKKLPKKIAGVKIPRTVRKSALGEFAGSKVGQALIAEAVMAGLVLVAKQQAKSQRRKRGAAKPDSVNLTPSTLAFAFSEAGRAFSNAVRGAPPAEPPDANWPLEEPGKVRKTAKAAPAVSH